MHKGRLEAFTDAVIAILITIMVLELRPPERPDFEALKPLLPIFFTYLLSFVNLAIYWNNHHHLFQAAKTVNGGVLWANMHLLFWLSMIPFTTDWLDQGVRPAPVIAYGIVLFCSGLAYQILTWCLVKANGRDSEVAKGLQKGPKETISVAIYLLGIVIAWWQPYVSCSLYVVVALMWLVPDRRFEPKSA